ncbi:MAG TPA: hypothetical protein PK971_13800 [Saprospiraceae bacterium]|nr:hypothetical protein [Saprospiraceae bacterium]HND89402.1 hypothetical protein [Saprospiraceae bacterium]
MKPANRTLIFANLIALSAVLAMNWLSNSLPLNGHTPAELSDQYPNLFVPAGLTFSIWGVIYTWLLVWAGFQVAALRSSRWASKVEPMVERAGWWFVLTCVLNIAWLFAWHWEQMMLSVLIMVGLLYVLLRLNEGAGVGRSASNVLEKRAAHWPFGIYQGWITVALIANVTALLVSRGWSSSLPEATMALIMILAGALVANSMLFNRNNVPHALAVSWAFLGIYLKRNGAPEPGSDSVALLALVCCIGLAAASVWQWRRWNSY